MKGLDAWLTREDPRLSLIGCDRYDCRHEGVWRVRYTGAMIVEEEQIICEMHHRLYDNLNAIETVSYIPHEEEDAMFDQADLDRKERETWKS